MAAPVADQSTPLGGNPPPAASFRAIVATSIRSVEALDCPRGVEDWQWIWLAACQGRADICGYLHERNGDSIVWCDEEGRTLLYMVMRQFVGRSRPQLEETGRWLLARGADVAAVTTDCVMDEPTNTSILALACQTMPTSFVMDILHNGVPPEHLNLRDIDDWSPIRYAVANDDLEARATTIPLLILSGARVVEVDFPETQKSRRGFDEASRQLLRSWAERELCIHRTFVALVLGCGIHGRPSCAQEEEGRDPSALPTQLLTLLRGATNTEPRQYIARALGVRFGDQLRRVREAREALVAMGMGGDELGGGDCGWATVDAPPGVGLAYPQDGRPRLIRIRVNPH